MKNEVVERLRASKQRAESENYQAGFSAGKDWAERDAEAADLDRLEVLKAQRDADVTCGWQDYFDPTDAIHLDSLADRLYMDIRSSDDDSPRSNARDFWKRAVGDDREAEYHLANPDFLRGFAEGALEVWREVQGQL